MLFEMINDEMDGHTVNRGAIKRILSMFMSIESNLNINCVLDNPSIFNAKIKEKIVKTFTTFIDVRIQIFLIIILLYYYYLIF